jgi:predicted transcriptional regulator
MHINEAVKVAVIVRAVRNALNLSQGGLATMAGCSRPTINRIETLGESSSRTNTVDDVLRFFREQGVEVRVADDEVVIRFSRDALIRADANIRGVPVVQPASGTE